MSAASDKLLTDIVGELQALRVQVAALQEALTVAKIEVVLTAKAKPKRRRKRRPFGPDGLPR